LIAKAESNEALAGLWVSKCLLNFLLKNMLHNKVTTMNKQEYLKRLSELLKLSYQQLKDTNGRSQFGGEHIQGYMEAGLISGVVDRLELESTIDGSYKVVFGVTFKERANVMPDSEGVLDVPTWIRRGRKV
jgi:hypothetical protein